MSLCPIPEGTIKPTRYGNDNYNIFLDGLSIDCIVELLLHLKHQQSWLPVSSLKASLFQDYEDL